MLGRGTAVLRSALEGCAGHAVAQLALQMGQLSVNGAAAAANGAATPSGEDGKDYLKAFKVSLKVWEHCPCWSTESHC